jgi:hypothetical protein
LEDFHHGSQGRLAPHGDRAEGRHPHSSEQGAADIDVAYWARTDKFGIEGWRAVDSSPGCIIAYADPELKCWMPMPRAGDIAAALPFDGDEKELFGSGI